MEEMKDGTGVENGSYSSGSIAFCVYLHLVEPGKWYFGELPEISYSNCVVYCLGTAVWFVFLRLVIST